jgi:mRNA interferase RelE/StbE
MEIKIDKSFQKDTSRIKDNSILQRIVNTIANVQKANNLTEIKNLKKIKGTTSMYRIRVGDYRIGIITSNSTDKYFPK